MCRNQIQREMKRTLYSTATIALVLIALIACDTAAPPANNSAGLTATVTPTVQQFSSSFDTTKAALEPFSPPQLTARAIRGTELALTPSTTSYATTPQPSPTWALGMITCPPPPNSHTFQPSSCWRGFVNEQLISVAGGSEWFDRTPANGVIMVFNSPYFDIPLGYDGVGDTVFYTPQPVGSVHIISIDVSQFTFASDNPQIVTTFTFDVATRQFVPPPCGQGGACTPVVTEVATPMLTVTAVH